MYNIDPLKIRKHGLVTREDRKNLCNADQVLCYCNAWDKSNKYTLGFAANRNIFISTFLHKVLKIEELPNIEAQFEILYDNFDEFKRILNKTKGNIEEIED